MTHRIISPVDGSVVAERDLADDAEVERVLAAAHAARRTWRAIPVTERVQLCRSMIGHLVASVDDIAPEITRLMGRPVRHAPNEILGGTRERALHMASIAVDELADIEVPPAEGVTKFIRRDPIGTVLVIAPWNYPYLTTINSVVPALLAGNTVVLKHASQTLPCAERLAEACAAAGIPAGVLQYVHASHRTVEKMIADPRIGFVVFTGSVRGGAAIERAAAGRFIGVGTELGGKDPAYVRHDADLAFTVSETVDGAFFNSGQSCCAIERIYVHRSVWDEYVERFVAETRGLVLGDPRDRAPTIGPRVNAAAADFVRGQVTSAVARGARTLVDETHFAAARAGSPYMGPVVLVGVDHSMDVMREESFGPVIGLMPVDSDDEAVALMNDSPYGLTASVWTSDESAAVGIGQSLETGTVYMNRCDYVDPALVWTGVKNTGSGIALSRFGFDPYTRTKSFHVRRH